MGWKECDQVDHLGWEGSPRDAGWKRPFLGAAAVGRHMRKMGGERQDLNGRDSPRPEGGWGRRGAKEETTGGGVFIQS